MIPMDGSEAEEGCAKAFPSSIPALSSPSSAACHYRRIDEDAGPKVSSSIKTESRCEKRHPHQRAASSPTSEDGVVLSSSVVSVSSIERSDEEVSLPNAARQKDQIEHLVDETGVRTDDHLNLTYSEWQRRYAVLLYAITAVLLFADQNLLAPNLTAAADEFGFGPDERDTKLGGHIALAFFVLGAPASFVVGCLADVWSRAPLFAVVVLMGEGSCMLTYWSRTYAQLFVLRALTGISVGGALPLIASVLGDLYPPEERSAVMGAVGVGTGIGIALGQGIAGFVGPRFGWRFPFLVVSIPAMACGLLVLFTVRDPERGAMERVTVDGEGLREVGIDECNQHGDVSSLSSFGGPSHSTIEMSHQATGSSIQRSQLQRNCLDQNQQTPLPSSRADNSECCGIVHNEDSFSLPDEECSDQYDRTNRGRAFARMFSQSLDWRSWSSHLRSLKSLLRCRTVRLVLLQGAPGCLPWGIVNTYLNDYLSEDCGMTVEGATLTITAFGFGNFLGILVGGAGGNYLYKIDPRLPSLLSGSSAVLGCFPMWVLINTVDASSSAMYTIAVSVLAGLGSGVTGPIVKSTLQNVTLPNARGQAFAFLNIFDDFGRGLGPVFVATMITSFGGRTPAFNVGVSGWLFCGVLNACIFFTFRSDEERMRRDLTAGMLRAERNCGEMIIEDQHPSVEIGSNKDSKHDVVPLLVL
eukprot:CAMPEP_0113598736 /NCGR_PEP_ID=MMETSP0015_2-20120614/41757_1 /TAXON_ID=2838 /ORGANISM="Odontella" /LENGTH=695 /DNA_ID=CAMNT_0000506795 /DNA_START=44 /DNA_END=2128 /DNA_ORIENTATION=+ /assembly_acc=CAM_ASM_000160